MLPIRSRLFLYVPLTIAAIIFAGYTFVWTLGARAIENAVTDWVEDQRTAGMQIDHGKIASTGFPFLLRTRIDKVSIAQPEIGRWQSEQLYIDALPYDLKRIIFSPQGQQQISITNAQAPFNALVIDARMIRASIGQQKATGWQFILQSHDACVTTSDNTHSARVGDLRLNVAPAPLAETTITTALSITAISYQGIEAATPEQSKPIRLDAFDLGFDIERTDLLDDQPAFEAWQREAAKLTLHRLSLSDDPAQLIANGAVGLDSDGYASGTITSALSRPGNFLQTLDRLGLIGADQKDTLTTSLAMTSLAGGGTINTRFEFRGGQLVVDGVAVGDVPKLFDR